jgi:hypothetical protein
MFSVETTSGLTLLSFSDTAKFDISEALSKNGYKLLNWNKILA